MRWQVSWFLLAMGDGGRFRGERSGVMPGWCFRC